MAPRREDPKLIIRVINFEVVQPICSAYINVTDRQTDRRTDSDVNKDLGLKAKAKAKDLSHKAKAKAKAKD